MAENSNPAPLKIYRAEWFQNGVFFTSGTFHAPSALDVKNTIRKLNGSHITVRRVGRHALPSEWV